MSAPGERRTRRVSRTRAGDCCGGTAPAEPSAPARRARICRIPARTAAESALSTSWTTLAAARCRTRAHSASCRGCRPAPSGWTCRRCERCSGRRASPAPRGTHGAARRRRPMRWDRCRATVCCSCSGSRGGIVPSGRRRQRRWRASRACATCVSCSTRRRTHTPSRCASRRRCTLHDRSRLLGAHLGKRRIASKIVRHLYHASGQLLGSVLPTAALVTGDDEFHGREPVSVKHNHDIGCQPVERFVSQPVQARNQGDLLALVFIVPDMLRQHDSGCV